MKAAAPDPIVTCRCCRQRGQRSGLSLVSPEGRIVCTCLPRPVCALCMRCAVHCACPVPALHGRVDMAAAQHLTFIFDEIAAERAGAILEIPR